MKLLLLAALAGSALAAAATGAAPGTTRPAAGVHEVGWDHVRPQWSPDGSLILFERAFEPPKASETIRLAVMRPGGGGRRLVEQASPNGLTQWDTEARWSPDGRRIVFDRGGPDTAGLIMVADASGRGVRQLTSDPAVQDSGPAWSPDGSLIAFTRYEHGYSIYVMRADGTGLRRLTSGFAPVWAPDGRSLALAREGTRRETAVYVVGLDGSGLRKLTDGGSSYPDGWSPDGGTLLFERVDKQPSIWTMRADGSEQRRLATGGAATLSPDGARIVFHRSHRSGGTTRVDVLVMGSDGRDVRTVFRGGAGASWSPDGKLLALGAPGPCPGWGIYVLRATGGGAHRVTNDCRIVGTPGPDVLAGTRERDLIRGLGGDDVVRANPTDRGPVYYGRNDDDFVDGGAGNDRISGGRGSDLLLGGPGNDVLHGDRGPDRLLGGLGNDVLDGGRFYDRLAGGPGDDLILARDGFPRDRVSCGPGRDRVVADPGDLVAADCETVVR